MYELQSVNLVTSNYYNNEQVMTNQQFDNMQLNSSLSGSTSSVNNNNNINLTNSMVNVGGTGIIRVKKKPNRDVAPFSVIQMDLIKVVSL